jgi:hypothetical protein
MRIVDVDDAVTPVELVRKKALRHDVNDAVQSVSATGFDDVHGPVNRRPPRRNALGVFEEIRDFFATPGHSPLRDEVVCGGYCFTALTCAAVTAGALFPQDERM